MWRETKESTAFVIIPKPGKLTLPCFPPTYIFTKDVPPNSHLSRILSRGSCPTRVGARIERENHHLLLDSIHSSYISVPCLNKRTASWRIFAHTEDGLGCSKDSLLARIKQVIPVLTPSYCLARCLSHPSCGKC